MSTRVERTSRDLSSEVKGSELETKVFGCSIHGYVAGRKITQKPMLVGRAYQGYRNYGANEEYSEYRRARKPQTYI